MGIKWVSFSPVDGEIWPIGYQYRTLGRNDDYGWDCDVDEGDVISGSSEHIVYYEFRKPVCDCFQSPSVSIDDGGDAFPGQYPAGMSLRDYFAAHVVANVICLSVTTQGSWDDTGAAVCAYEVADAMLAARKVGAK